MERLVVYRLEDEDVVVGKYVFFIHCKGKKPDEELVVYVETEEDDYGHVNLFDQAVSHGLIGEKSRTLGGGVLKLNRELGEYVYERDSHAYMRAEGRVVEELLDALAQEEENEVGSDDW